MPHAEKTPSVSELSLDYAHRDGKTIFTSSRFTHPWYAFPPLYLDSTGCATTFLANPSGGFVGGDHCTLSARLGTDAHVVLTTPSATKVYRTMEHPARQSIGIDVGANAVLEWIPELTIPFAGSRFEQTITIRLDTDASLILWDALAAGRIARGERWAFDSFGNRITIMLANGTSLEERYTLSGQNNPSLAFHQEWNYVGSLFLVSEKVPSATRRRIEEEAVAALASPHVLGGVSESSIPGLVVKVVARSATELNAVFERLWGIVRRNVWQIGIPALRRY